MFPITLDMIELTRVGCVITMGPWKNFKVTDPVWGLVNFVLESPLRVRSRKKFNEESKKFTKVTRWFRLGDKINRFG